MSDKELENMDMNMQEEQDDFGLDEELSKILDELEDESDEDVNDEEAEEISAKSGIDIDKLVRDVKAVKKFVKHRIKTEESERMKSLLDEFFRNASDEEKELAEIYLDGVETYRQAQKAIDKIRARAAKLAGE